MGVTSGGDYFIGRYRNGTEFGVLLLRGYHIVEEKDESGTGDC